MVSEPIALIALLALAFVAGVIMVVRPDIAAGLFGIALLLAVIGVIFDMWSFAFLAVGATLLACIAWLLITLITKNNLVQYH